MPLQLFPRTSAFSTHFRSLAQDVVVITRLLAEHFDAPAHIVEAKERAQEIEKHADTSTQAAIHLLNTSFITPFDREDIHYFVHELDDIVDLSEDILKNIYLYGFVEKNGACKKFATLLVEASLVLQELIEKYLDPPRYNDTVKELKQKLHNIEDEGDGVFANAIQDLFESERDPIELIKRKEIIEMLEDLTDQCRSVGNIIENIILKSR